MSISSKKQRVENEMHSSSSLIMTNPARVLNPIVRKVEESQLIREDLNEKGFSVIQDILTVDEQSDFYDYFWDAVSQRVPALKKSDKSSWVPENCEWRGSYGAGQFKYYGMAQEKHCWLIRTNKLIRQVFENAVYDGDDCCVSLDGCAALFGPTKSALKLHVDLVPGIPGYDFGSVQGAYNLYGVGVDAETGKAGAGFMCVPGSHKTYMDRWAEVSSKIKFAIPKKHWLVLDEDSPLQGSEVLVLSPPNSLIIWKSELLHKNYGGDFTASELGDRLCRLTQFVAFQPKRHRTEKIRQKKIKNVLDGVCGNHWAALGHREPIKPFPAWGNHPVKVLKPITIGELSEEILDIL